jgi:hypothetical protein
MIYQVGTPKQEHAPAAPKIFTKKEVFSPQNMLFLLKKLGAQCVGKLLEMSSQ